MYFSVLHMLRQQGLLLGALICLVPQTTSCFIGAMFISQVRWPQMCHYSFLWWLSQDIQVSWLKSVLPPSKSGFLPFHLFFWGYGVAILSMDRSENGSVWFWRQFVNARRAENTSDWVNPLLDLHLFKYLDYGIWLSICILAPGSMYVWESLANFLFFYWWLY